MDNILGKIKSLGFTLENVDDVYASIYKGDIYVGYIIKQKMGILMYYGMHSPRGEKEQTMFTLVIDDNVTSKEIYDCLMTKNGLNEVRDEFLDLVLSKI